MTIASGEWWINNMGNAQFADGDVGDQNHAGMALDTILAEHDINLEEEPDAPEIAPTYSLSDKAKRWLKRRGVPKKVIAMLDGGDPREWMIEHYGWVRLAGTNAELWQFDADTLGTLREGIWEAWEGDAWDDIDPEELDFEVGIEEAKTRRTFAVPLKALMDVRMDAESLMRLGAEGEIVQAPTAPALRAAWARKAARERGVEENPAKRRYLDPEIAVAQRFGTTDSPKTAFYILSDGTFVDSGRQPRKTDHREIMQAFMDDDFNMLVKVPSTVIKTYREKSQWELVRWFMMKTGAIRAHPETGGLYLCKPPTSSQYRAIREWSDWFSPQAAPLSGTGVIIEYDPTCGDCGEGHFTKEFHAGEATERIVSVIELMIDGLTRKKNPAGTSMEDQWKSYIQKAVGKNRVKFDNNYTVFRDDKGKPTGTVELYFEYPKGTRPATVYLSLIAVPPEHRRRGHGTTMLSLLTQFADNQGWRIAGFAQAWGGVNLGQGDLVRWYKKFGFKIDTEGGMIREPKARKTP